MEVLGHVVGADHGGDAQAARQDGGVRHGAAELGHEARHPPVAQQDSVGGGQVLGDDDAAFHVFVGGMLELAPDQNLLHMDYHMVHVVLAGAQVLVVHGLEHLHQGVAANLQGPLRPAELVADQVQGRLGDGGVLQHQQVGVDEGGYVLRGGRGYLIAHRL